MTSEVLGPLPGVGLRKRIVRASTVAIASCLISVFSCFQTVKSEAEGQKDAAGGASGPTENGDKAAAGGDGGAAAQAQEGAAAMEQDEEEEEEDEDEAAAAMMPIRGPLPPEDGCWASCIRLLDPVEGVTVECLELGEA